MREPRRMVMQHATTLDPAVAFFNDDGSVTHNEVHGQIVDAAFQLKPTADFLAAFSIGVFREHRILEDKVTVVGPLHAAAFENRFDFRRNAHGIEFEDTSEIARHEFPVERSPHFPVLAARGSQRFENRHTRPHPRHPAARPPRRKAIAIPARRRQFSRFRLFHLGISGNGSLPRICRHARCRPCRDPLPAQRYCRAGHQQKNGAHRCHRDVIVWSQRIPGPKPCGARRSDGAPHPAVPRTAPCSVHRKATPTGRNVSP